MVTMFDPALEVARLKCQQRIRRKPRASKLVRYHSELLALYAHGARVADLQRWLRKRRVRVAHSTISRWLAKQDG